MSKKSTKRTLTIILILLILCLASSLIPLLSIQKNAPEESNSIRIIGFIFLAYLPLIISLIIAISEAARNEKRQYNRKRTSRINTLLKVMVVIYVILPSIAGIILMIMNLKDSPVTEGSSGAIIYGGIPIPCGIPQGIPIWLLFIVLLAAVGFGLSSFLFKKIDEWF
jgi:flagellar basal body-associated protein FliL